MKAWRPQWPTLLLLEKKEKASQGNASGATASQETTGEGRVPLLLPQLDVAFSESGAILGFFSCVFCRGFK